jgi:hypothetical protein
MYRTLEAIVINGKVKVLDAEKIPDGRALLTVLGQEKPRSNWKEKLLKHAGCIEGGPDPAVWEREIRKEWDRS